MFATLGSLSYLLGWALSRKGIPISLETPVLTGIVRMAYGMLLSVPILLLMFAFLPAPYIIPSLAVLVVVAVGLRLRADSSEVLPRLRRLGTEGPKLLLDRIRQEPLAYALFAFSFAYFVSVVAYMGWPPVGDITMLHGPITTYLAADGYSGVASRIWYFYPIGFHAFPAALSGPFGLYPGEAVFVFGGFVAALIPSLMYVIARAWGARPLIALMSFTAAFIVHPSTHLEKWVLGPFFNGPYPNMVAYLVILLVLLHLPRRVSKSSLLAYAKPAILFSAILSFIYPSFVPLILGHLLLLSFVVFIRNRRVVVPGAVSVFSRKRLLFAGIIVLSAIGVVLLAAPLISLIWQTYTTSPPGFLAYQLDSRFFIDNLTGVLILVGVAIGLRNVINGRAMGAGSFYLFVFALLLLSLDLSLYLSLWPILPSRVVMILGITAWPLLASEIQILLDRARRGRDASSQSPRSRMTKRIAVLPPLIAIALVLVAQGQATGVLTPLNTPEHYGWFGRSPYFSNDFGAIEWLTEHVDASELILSDGSFISRYALSLEPLWLTHDLPFERLNRSAAEALDRVWIMPSDEQYIRQVLEFYNVAYILVATEPWTLDLINVLGYRLKSFTPAEYAEIFDSYPFLRVEYSAGSTRLFRVLPEML